MSKRPIRVLHLIHWLTTGGIERWLISMLQEIDRERYQMDICCKGSGVGELAPVAGSLGANVWHIPLDWTHVRYAYQLQALIRQQGYDIVNNHLAVYAGMPTLVAKLSRVPTIVSFHNTDLSTDVIFNPMLRAIRDIYSQLSIPLAVRLADVVTGCSEGVIRTMADQYGVSHTKARVLYYGVDVPSPPDAGQRAAVRREIGVPEEAPLIVHIGRFAPQKNHGGLLKIAKQVLTHYPSTMFVLVGDGSLRPAIESEILASNLSPSVRLLGIRQDVERILGASDVLLIPSLWEGFGLVAIEANAVGIPVVGSDVPGLREAVENGETGILLPVDSTDAFVKALGRLISDATLRNKMGEAGRQRVLSRFSRRVSALRLSELYDECLRDA
jgi:glycosyltransferase EpsF